MKWVAVAAFMLGSSRPARADESGASVPQADDASDPQLATARTITESAKRLFVAGHYPAALAEFTRVYEILDGHPRQYWVLFDLAACNERLFRYDVALNLYEQYLARAPASEPDRDQVVAIMRELRSLLATLVVQSSVASEVWVDDRRLGATPGRWLVPPGRHSIEVRAALYAAERREIQLGVGQTRSLRFELQQLSSYTGPPPAYFWTATAVTAAAAATGVTLGAMALSARDDGRDRAAVSIDSSADAERTRHLALAADVCFGTAVVFGATAVVLYFVTDWSHKGSKGMSAQAAPNLALGRHAASNTTFRIEF